MKAGVIRRILRWVGVGALVVILLLAGMAGWVWWHLRASLAQLEGKRTLVGLSAPVVVERDALGVPTFRATNRLDVTRALGFVHAQERFFQMDLFRRSAAGELAELFGPGLIAQDGWSRRHQFRKRARAYLQDPATDTERAMFQAYAEGVNAGLRSLGAAPPEYLLLRVKPKPWEAEDAILAGCAMFFGLQNSDGSDERLYAVLGRLFPPAVRDFYLPKASAWHAAVDDSTPALPPLPGPEVFSLQSLTHRAVGNEGVDSRTEKAMPPGSNNWAVDGSVSTTGSAIVANDMHLDLQLPPYWFRARLLYTDPELGAQDVIGITLPGTPAIVVGSNRQVAWTFTNAMLDCTDLVQLEVDPVNPQRYRTPAGWRDFEFSPEIIRAKGGSDQTLVITNTVWGPVVETPGLPGLHALCWIAHQPGALNLGLLELERARSVAAALELAPLTGVPLENLVVGDKEGSIGYILIGRLPLRFGYSGNEPVSWADGTRGWNGFLPAEDYPRSINPPGGRLWTANHRVLGSPEYLGLNPVSQDYGARAQQIRDDLRRMQNVTEPDMLEIHRDDRGLYLERWQQLMLTVLERGAPANPSWKELKPLIEGWRGRAVPESRGYRLVAEFREAAIDLVMKPVRQRLREADVDPDVWPGWTLETPVWEILSRQATHLLDPTFASVDALLEQAVNDVLETLAKKGVPPTQATWGQRNTLWMQHPIGRAVPALSRWLDLPPVQVPGDENMPRMQGPSFGATERMVVSPGREEQGIFHMPGGQSGHFLSRFYRAGHEAWLKVEPSPLLPGATVYRLMLLP